MPVWSKDDFDSPEGYWKDYAAKHSGGASISASPPRSAWDVFMDSVHNAMSSAGSGMNAIFVRGNEAAREDDLARQYASDHNLSPEQADAIVHQNRERRASDVRETRASDALRMEDEQRRRSRGSSIGAKTAEIAGSIAGDLNPTYAIGGFGLNALERTLGMGAVTGANDIVGQGDEVRQGIRDRGDPIQTLEAIAGGAGLQGVGEGIAKGIGAALSKAKLIDLTHGLLKRGLTPEQARGVAAGVVAESGGKTNAVNPKSGAMGYGQWLGSRKDELIRRYGPNPTHDQQLDFLVHELKGGDPGGPKVLAHNDQKKVLDSYINDFMRPAKGGETSGDIRRGNQALGHTGPEDLGQVDIVSGEQPSVEAQTNANDKLAELAQSVPHSDNVDASFTGRRLEQLGNEHDVDILHNIDFANRIHKGIDLGVVTEEHLPNIENARDNVAGILRDFDGDLTVQQKDRMRENLDILDSAIERLRPADEPIGDKTSVTSSHRKFMGEEPKTGHVNDNRTDGLEPSEETIRSKPGVNARRMAKMLGPQLYGDPSSMGPVSIKEVLQNSFDAVKTALQKGHILEGKIDIETDPHARTIRMRDNGIGMTPETLGSKFLEIAGTGKEGEQSSGGFGIAKMLFLYGNKELHVKTMRDGKVAELRTTGEKLFDALEDPTHAPDVHVRDATEMDEVDFGAKHGTEITMTLPKDFHDPASGETKEIVFPESEYHVPALGKSPLFAPIDVRWNGDRIYNVGKEFPANDYKTFANVDFGWGKADIYVTHSPKKHVYGDNLHVLSNGLWQFDSRIAKKPGEPFSDPVPYTFFVDVHPTVKPDEAGYPFSFNRQGFTDQAKKDFNDVTAYINKLYAHANIGNEAKSFGQVQYMNPHTGDLSHPIDITPEIPQSTGGFRGIQEGDKVAVKDGRMFVNGKELPALTPEELKKSVPDYKELMVDPNKVDPTRIMIHDNTVLSNEETPFSEHMRIKFGEKPFNTFLHDVGGAFMQLRDMVSELDPKYLPLKSEAIGISFDPAYRGVSIRVPFHGTFINPLAPEGSNIGEQAYGIIGTMIHELAHFNVRSHNAEFPAEMQRITYKLAAKHSFMEWQKDAAEALASHKDIIAYGKELIESKRVKNRGGAFKDGVSNFESSGGDARLPEGVPEAGREGQGSEGVLGDSSDRSGSPALSSSFGTKRPEGINPKKLPEEMKGPEGHEDKPVLKNQKKAILDKLADALEQGKPIRREAEEAISQERARRIAAAMKVRADKGGEEGFYAELASLKGEMGRPKIQSIRDWFTPAEIDGLYNIVKHSPQLQGYDSITAQKALNKLLGKDYGEIPTAREIALLAKAMPEKAKLWRQLLENEEGSLNLPDGALKSLAVNVAGLPRTLKASFDFSAPFRQGMFLVGRKEFWKAMPEMFKAFFDEGKFKEIQEEIYNRPTYHLMNKAGLETTRNNAGLVDREEAFISQFAEKIPGVRHSERAYIAFLNKLRADVFDDFVKKGEVKGIDFIHDPHYLKSAARYINSATGRGNLNAVTRDARVLTNVLFSPKLMKSRIDMLNPGFYIGLHPAVRKEAAKAGLIYASTAMSIAGLAFAAGADVDTDPRSSDFMKIKIGNTRLDVTGGFQPYVRFYSQFLTGQQKSITDDVVKNIGWSPIQKIWKGEQQGPFKPTTRLDVLYRFFENKESPNMGEITRLLRGTDAVGRPLGSDNNPITDGIAKASGTKVNRAVNEVVNMFTPLIVADTYQAYQDLGAKGLLTAIPNAGGVGVQTYTPKAKSSGTSWSKSDFGGASWSKKDFQ